MKIKNYFSGNVKLIELNKYKDNRGFFIELFNKKNFIKLSIPNNFVQDNFSFSKNIGTIRGLHFQENKFKQSKLIYTLNGKIFDVVVDLRKNSPTYGNYKSFILSDKNNLILYVSKHFAHGFCTLEKNTMVMYKVSQYYKKEYEKTIMWNDKDIAINWPNVNKKFILSDKDKQGILFKDF